MKTDLSDTLEIKLHNSATRSKEAFAPIDPKDVRMYVCGPTVYDRAHIGNARPVVVFDVLYRLLRHVYGEAHVTYVRNITDIDDKINARAAATLQDGETPVAAIRRITDMTAGWFKDDMAALGTLPPTHQPRATEFVPQMVTMIADLIAKGNAYEAEGHVLFEVSTYDKYGALSGRSTDDMIAGARVEVAPYKRDPMDFVLWKPSTDNQPGWDSPWGRGRPGWHIECSAMASELLGETFDIHGGGADLQFPHHENEIAQSCCAAPDAGFANVWMHNGMVNVEGKKMSKSLGNFLTVEDLRSAAPTAVLRLTLLKSHYRGILDWTEQALGESKKALITWRRAYDGHRDALGKDANPSDVDELVLEALADDLNTPKAIARLFELAKDARGGDVRAADLLRNSLAFLELDAESILDGAAQSSLETVLLDNDDPKAFAMITALSTQRDAAKAANDWDTADAIRAQLREAGVTIIDGKKGEPAEWKLEPYFKAAKLEAGAVVGGDLVEAVLVARTDARAAKDFARADALRDALAAADVVIMDKPGEATEWRPGPAFDASKLEGLV